MTNETTKAGDLGCPQCPAVSLATVETVTVDVDLVASRNADGTLELTGCDTQIRETTYAVLGVTCKACGWEYFGSDWAEQLVVAPAADVEVA